MAGFIYEKPFRIDKDTTKYRLLTRDYVKVIDVDGRKILNIDSLGLELLAGTAVSELSFFLRTSHLQKLASILDDPEATDNDRFVAYMMLRNSVIAAKGDLPWCQDTGTAIVIGKKGEQVWTGVNDALYISKGIYKTFREKNLRYSQIVPFSMFDEKNSCTNL
ncbi:MAG: fumarate hydratase, partial [Bacteroidales bacterium]|nr:fumarate hydratase [Bacteroidales bacterium]